MNVIKPWDKDEIITTPHSVSEWDIAEVEQWNKKIVALNDEKNKQKKIQINQANDLRTQLWIDNKSSNFFIDWDNPLHNPLREISKKLDYYERKPWAEIEKNPLNRAKKFIAFFENAAISEIYSLRWNHYIKETEKIVSEIVFDIWLLARDEKYKNLWQETKNKIINASIDVLWYNFKDIEKFIQIKHTNLHDFRYLMDSKLTRNGIGDGMVITPNNEWYNSDLDVTRNALEASLYILRQSPYLSFWLAKNLVGPVFDMYSYELDMFDKYINKYNK